MYSGSTGISEICFRFVGRPHGFRFRLELTRARRDGQEGRAADGAPRRRRRRHAERDVLLGGQEAVRVRNVLGLGRLGHRPRPGGRAGRPLDRRHGQADRPGPGTDGGRGGRPVRGTRAVLDDRGCRWPGPGPRTGQAAVQRGRGEGQAVGARQRNRWQTEGFRETNETQQEEEKTVEGPQ